MSGSGFTIGYDGVRYLFTSNTDGVVTTARLAAGTHTNAEHDAAIVNLRQAYTTLRQWSLDAQDAFNSWPNKTAAQKDATQREVIRRLGVFFDRFADLMVSQNQDA